MNTNGVYRIGELKREGTCKDSGKPWAHFVAFDFHAEYDEDAFVMVHVFGDHVDYLKRNLGDKTRRVLLTGVLKLNKYMETKTVNTTINLGAGIAPLVLPVNVDVEKCTLVIEACDVKFIDKNPNDVVEPQAQAIATGLTPEQIAAIQQLSSAQTPATQTGAQAPAPQTNGEGLTITGTAATQTPQSEQVVVNKNKYKRRTRV